jgi:hypothetical protein
MNTIEQLLNLKSGLFFVPDYIDSAIKKADEIAKGSGDPASVYMAIQILFNGIANQLGDEVKDE